MADTGSSKSSRDVDDISLDDTRPAGKPRRGGAVLVLILIVLAVVVIAVIVNNQKKAAAEAKRQAEVAEGARQAQMGVIKGNLQAAYELAAAGNVEGAIDKLRVADAQLGNIVSTANSENNSVAATQALNQKKYVSDALNALEAKQQEMSAVAMEQFATLTSQFGLQAPATPAATTPEATTAPVTGAEAAPATGTETAPAPGAEAPVAPAPETAPVAPATTAPQAPAAPAAPVAPAPAAPAAPPAP